MIAVIVLAFSAALAAQAVSTVGPTWIFIGAHLVLILVALVLMFTSDEF